MGRQHPAIVRLFLEQVYGLPRIVMAIDLNHNTAPRLTFAHNAQEAQQWITQQEQQREALNADWQWYFAAGDTKSKRRKKENIYQLQAVWADVDPPSDAKPDAAPDQWESWRQAFSPTTFRLTPTFVIDSGSGFQPFWRFDRPIEPDLGESIMKAIAAAHDTDSSVADAARVMRLPGTMNTKPGVNRLANLSSFAGCDYHPDELLDAYPPVEPEPALVVTPDFISQPTPPSPLEMGLATKELSQRIDYLARTQPGNPTPRHKQALGILAMCAGQSGVTDEQINRCAQSVQSALDANGYTAQYGSADVERLITDAIAFGRDNPLRPLRSNGSRSDGFSRGHPPTGTVRLISKAPTISAPPPRPFVL